MIVELNKVAIFLFVLAIGNCAPQRDISIAPSKVNQQASYEVVTSDPVNPISTVTTPLPATPSTIGQNTTTDPPTTPPTTTKSPDTTTDVPTTTTTTVAPTTTTVTPSTTSTTSTTTTTTAAPVPPSPTPTTSTTSTTPPTPTTPKPEPIPCRRFDGPSFIGGIVLTVGLIAISFVVWKFYKSRTERNYHTL